MWVVGATCLGTVRSVAVAASLSHHWTHTSPRIPITTRPPLPLIPLAHCILCGTEGSAWYIAITTIRLMRRVLENVPTWLPSMSKADAEAAQALVCAELSTDESKVCAAPTPPPTTTHTRNLCASLSLPCMPLTRAVDRLCVRVARCLTRTTSCESCTLSLTRAASPVSRRLWLKGGGGPCLATSCVDWLRARSLPPLTPYPALDYHAGARAGNTFLRAIFHRAGEHLGRMIRTLAA